jgi:adenylate cyclase class 2
MQNIYEVELRYKLDGEGCHAKALEETLVYLGFTHSKSIRQEDIYYSSKHKDFIESEECLRIRTVDGLSEITWKPPSCADMKVADEFWKEEVDLQIKSQHDVAKRLLTALDFFEVAIVEKQRTSYEGPNGVEVSLDLVSSVGTFVEIEVKHSDANQGKEIIRQIAVEIGVSNYEICRTPYRDLVRNLKNA